MRLLREHLGSLALGIQDPSAVWRRDSLVNALAHASTFLRVPRRREPLGACAHRRPAAVRNRAVKPRSGNRAKVGSIN